MFSTNKLKNVKNKEIISNLKLKTKIYKEIYQADKPGLNLQQLR